MECLQAVTRVQVKLERLDDKVFGHLREIAARGTDPTWRAWAEGASRQIWGCSGSPIALKPTLNHLLPASRPQLRGNDSDRPSALSHDNFRVDRFEFASGVADFELPVDAALPGVAVGIRTHGHERF